MKIIRTSQAVSRLSISLAIVVPLIFIAIVILKNQRFPAGFEIIKFGGIMLAIGLVVWLSVRIAAVLADLFSQWLDKLLDKNWKYPSRQAGSAQKSPENQYRTKIIDAEILEEEHLHSAGSENTGLSDKAHPDSHHSTAVGIEPDWAKAPPAGNVLSETQQKRKRLIGPPSRLSKTIMVTTTALIFFALINNLMENHWHSLLAPLPLLWGAISLWRIWDPKNAPAAEDSTSTRNGNKS
ncbi:hypothetical protein O4H49_01905 [Kiloniella laminariae]|uniref:Uncharacterized protein n=1 Tax=Kiloniella laminariae TaxID=454162 RepID=A0ABT4LEI4_9PROT|nr:hypothetical protein [Kiloniella laminariae]MCZ4279512.1 hypothetical protein [Kiloniella laminariae]